MLTLTRLYKQGNGQF